MKKTILSAIILTLILITACQEKPIGGETDEHGCLGPAGYTWNEDIGACIREWELDESQKKAAKIVVAPMSYHPITITKVDTLRCPGCFVVHIKGADKDTTITLEDWKIVDTSKETGLFSCQDDSDCIPLPSDCHPRDCINKEYESNYEKPEACTMMFDLEAAYKPEDCICYENKCTNINKLKEITYDQAVEIAEKSECTEKGDLTQNYIYNAYTKTWWIDLEMKEEFKKDYCNPACVINEKTKTAEINWRCTGLLPP